MGEATEFMEQMEHAGHGTHGHGHEEGAKNLGRNIGLTMAILGVLLAFCSALVGAARTEFIAAMVEQTQTALKLQAVATKYRVLHAQLQQLHSLLPDPARFKSYEEQLAKLETGLTNPETNRIASIVDVQTKKVLETVTPTTSDMKHFARVIRHHGEEQEAAQEWFESYEAAIQSHFTAAERYELAQLCAEFGIVLASLALLFTNRKAWYLAMLMGGLSFGQVVYTYSHLLQAIAPQERKIEETKEKFNHLNREGGEAGSDEELLKEVEAMK